MPEFRKYGKSHARQIVDFNGVISGLGEWGIYCIDKGVMLTIRKLLSERGLWRTTYAVDFGTSGYYIPTDDEFTPISRAIADFLGGEDMSCDLSDALGGIENAIRAIKCNVSATAGVYLWSDGNYRYGSGTYGETSTLDSEAQSKGFDDYSDEMNHKCEAANAIVDGLISSLNNLSVLTFLQLTGLGVVFAVGVIAAPAGGIIAALAILAIALGGFAGLASTIDDNRQDLVCLLFNSDNTQEAYDDFHDFMKDSVIDLGPVELRIGAVYDLFGSMVSTDVMNVLFTSVGLPSVSGGVSCAGCLGVGITLYFGGSLSETAPGEYEGVSANYAPWGNQEMLMLSVPAGYEARFYNWGGSSLSQYTPDGNTWYSTPVPNNWFTGMTVTNQSTTNEFTVTFSVELREV